MAADKNNITKRSDLDRPLKQYEVDANFQEIKNVIDDLEEVSSRVNELKEYIPPESVVLSEGQTTVSLSSKTTSRMELYIEGAREFDFVVTNETTFELPQGFPEGTKIWIV